MGLASLLYYRAPVIVMALSPLLLGESMSALQIAGAACIIGGAMVGELVKPGEG